MIMINIPSIITYIVGCKQPPTYTESSTARRYADVIRIMVVVVTMPSGIVAKHVAGITTLRPS